MAQHSDMGAKGSAELHCHVAETAKAHHAELVARLQPEMLERRIGGDASAEQWRNPFERQSPRNAQHIILIDDDAG
jgi:hypothetical protein